MEQINKQQGAQENQQQQQQAVEDQLKKIYTANSEKQEFVKIQGFDFNQGLNWDKLFESYKNFGFQSSNLHQAIEEVNKMIKWRLSDEPVDIDKDGEDFIDQKVRQNTRCTIFLGYTSNMISCGMREIIRFLAQHKMIDCIVSSAGGIEEDFIKCLADFQLGQFENDDKELRKKALNRIGNILVPSENYCKFEDWLQPVFLEMYKEQKEKGTIWSPRSIIKRMGERINNEQSVYYWAAKNDIPVFCPAITDGAIGDMLFYFSYKYPGFIVDLVQDVREMNKLALKAKKSGVLVLGGGLVKHHILNANIWRNGADFGVFINTGIHYDGSDAGAYVSEAITWGKLSMNSTSVKVFCEASIVFPILVAQTFYKYKEIASRVISNIENK